MKVGVLALQGAFESHIRILESLGIETREIRDPQSLDDINGLVIPGGESTAISMLLESNKLRGPLERRISDGLPVFGTCAGMIMLSAKIIDGREDQVSLRAIDIAVRRNAFGRQVDSFETELEVTGLDTPFPSIFIRAPVVETVGNGVEIYAAIDDQIVLCGNQTTLVASFHPELSNDSRIHEMFVAMISRSSEG